MNWMFWKGDDRAQRLPGPRELPQRVGTYLVVQEKMVPDLVWTLRSVSMPRPGEKDLVDIRVYNGSTAQQAGVKVENYRSLNGRPDLILFDGWYSKETGAVCRRPGEGR